MLKKMKKMMCVGLGLFLFCLVSTQGHAELVSEWKFDGDAKDSKGNNHGTLKGSPAWGSNRFGDPGKALVFDGVNDYVNCGKHSSLQITGSLTIEMWVKWDKSSKNAKLIATGRGSQAKSQYLLAQSSNNRIFFLRGDGAKNARTPSQVISKGVWTHIVAVDDGTNLLLYLNAGTPTSRKRIANPSTEFRNLIIGRYGSNNGHYFKGVIDDVRIYSHALSPEDVKARYLQKPPPVPLKERTDISKEITIQQVSEAPVIDGNLSDGAWKKGKWYSGFRILEDLGQKAFPETSFAMAHDGENLYIAVRADEPEPTKMKALATERDGGTYMDDSIEIFIDSKGEGVSHYQFVVNSRGALFDSQATRGGASSKSEWNSDAKVATSVGKDVWFLEVSIPFSCLSFSPEDLSTWRFNISRSRFVTSKRELFTYAPMQGTFHDTRNFAIARIKDIDLSPFLLNVDLDRINGFLQPGQMVARAKLLIKNNSSFSRKVDITARLNVEGKETSAILRGIKFNQGAQHQDITIPLHVTGEGTLAVALQDTESGQVVRSQWFSVAVDYIPLKVDVLRPHYQNAIFSGQKVKDIELEVITAMAPEERQNYIFEFVLSSDKEILRNQTKIEGEKTIVSAPLPSLEIGDYRMQGRLIHRPTGKVIAKWQDVLRKLAPRKGEVRFDENMVCLIDNKPFLPFGINNQGSLQDAIEIGCNAIENFWIFRRGWKDKDIDKYFNKLHQAGLKLVVYPYPRGFPVPQAGKNNLSKPITPKQEEMLRSHLRKIRHYPEILAWYSANEPQPLGGWGPHIVSQKTMKQIDEIIKEEDPYHPTAIALRNISYYADTTAVLWPDPYPGFIKNGGWIHRHCPTKSVRQAIKVTKGRKPVWVILQAHDGALFGRQNDRAPNFVELRNQMHQAAVAGAKGFFWYCRYWIEPQVKMGLTYLAKECQLLREAIFAPESSQEFIAVKGVSKYPDLHLSRREVGEDTYLFAVSSANKKREIRFNVAGLKDRQLFVVGENHEVKLQRGEFTDSFEPYDTHIYTTNKSLARQLNMAGVCREIADISAKVIKPGNIAHKSNGTVVKFSKTTNHRYPSIDSVIDGIKATSYWGGGNWVEVTFAKPEKISKLVIDSNTSQLDIEAKKDGAWIKVAEVKTDKKASRRKIHTVKFPLIETRKLRLKGFSPLKIWEIEAYGK